jgi:hypothetical protein
MKRLLPFVICAFALGMTSLAQAATTCATIFCANYGGAGQCSTAGLYECKDGYTITYDCECKPPSPARVIKPSKQARMLTGGGYRFRGGPGVRRTQAFELNPHLTRLTASFRHSRGRRIKYVSMRLVNSSSNESPYGISSLGGKTYNYSETDETVGDFFKETFTSMTGSYYLVIRATGRWTVEVN